MSEHAGDADKPQMPRVLKELGDKAIRRHERRLATPALKVELSEGKWWFESPFSSDADDHWTALMFEAFATRSQATFRTFMIQLADLCSTEWNKDAEAWHPNEDELMAAVQVVRSVRPRNEAQACLAAQMVAVHLMQMKLSAQALNGGYPEPRSCAIAGKLARTYAMQLETMAKLKGKGTRQRITVRKTSTHEHKHIHLHQGKSKMGTNPMDQEEREQRKSKRLTNLRAAPRCLARTRQGTPCQCPATRAKLRCRLHGGGPGSGAPTGSANGAYCHGGWTDEAIEMRRRASRLLKVLREDSRSC